MNGPQPQVEIGCGSFTGADNSVWSYFCTAALGTNLMSFFAQLISLSEFSSDLCIESCPCSAVLLMQANEETVAEMKEANEPFVITVQSLQL